MGISATTILILRPSLFAVVVVVVVLEGENQKIRMETPFLHDSSLFFCCVVAVGRCSGLSSSLHPEKSFWREKEVEPRVRRGKRPKSGIVGVCVWACEQSVERSFL